MDTLENICQGGSINGYQFNITTAATKINYVDGFYVKSAIKNSSDQTIWNWKTEKEKEQPINPN